jgi:glycosyltransferase involved in cell wall biosynthesis
MRLRGSAVRFAAWAGWLTAVRPDLVARFLDQFETDGELRPSPSPSRPSRRFDKSKQDRIAGPSLSPKYSVIVVVYNEQEDVADLYGRLKSAMESNGETFEIVLVDDASRDGTYRLLREIAAVDSRVAVIKLRRSIGRARALEAGIDLSRGTFIIAMDGDLADSPSDIFLFLEKIAEGYDIVSGKRLNRTYNSWFVRVANWLTAKLSGVDIQDFGPTFKAYHREVLDHISVYEEAPNLIPILAAWSGASICEVPIHNPKGPSRQREQHDLVRIDALLGVLTTRFLLRFLSHPARLFGQLALLSWLAGAGLIFWLLTKHSSNYSAHVPLEIVAALLMLAAVNLFAIRAMGELRFMRNLGGRSQRKADTIERIIRDRTQTRSE